ncbi:MAG TPA: MOSC domain-containing protein [Actinomycetota bacterium]|nr:MOSC domain-containing protein [Actinomycetota bacterium]
MASNGSGVVRSVNVGQLRELKLRGKPHKTGIFKEPVEGRVRISGVSMEGDIQADRRFHGGPYKAVYSYTLEDYAWWEQELGRSLPPATFGENLTLEGISATDALIGERWAVGSAVLAVTQPREPCWKLAAKMEDSGFVRRFKDAGRAGAYLAIIQEGDVAAGDTVEVVSRPPHPISIGMITFLNNTDRQLARLFMELIQENPTPEEWEEVLGALNLPPKYPWSDEPASPRIAEGETGGG